MGWTKRQFVTAAFEEIGLAAYVFDLEAEQLQSALRRLDSMMAQWNFRGIRLGYPLPGEPENSDIDTETGVPDSANDAILTNLALRIAPGYGKTSSVDTKMAAKSGYDLLLSLAAVPMEMQMPRTLPVGAGNKPWTRDQPFCTPPVDPLLVGQDGPIEFN